MSLNCTLQRFATITSLTVQQQTRKHTRFTFASQHIAKYSVMFYLKTVLCHFPLLLRRAKGQIDAWVTSIR